jgi:glycosyltransferase involved in cell wall biosynthesis
LNKNIGSAVSTFPRILFITPCAFNKISGGGITFSNLFKSWPQECIATVHNDVNPTDDLTCNKYFFLGKNEIFFLGPFKNKSLLPVRSVVANNIDYGNISILNKTIRLTKHLLFGNIFPNAGQLTAALESFIEEFQPDIIYTILGSSGIMDIVEQVSDRYKLPVVVHIMDDWISSNYSKGVLSFFERSRVKKRFKRILENAAETIVISDAMKREYEQRYRRPFSVFQNTIDVDKWTHNPKVPAANEKKIFSMVYTGSIFPYAQLDALILACHAVLDLVNSGVQLEFSIYAPEHMSVSLSNMFESQSTIKFFPPLIDDSEYFRTLADADILLLPSNFDKTSLKFIGLSMPTKVPSYLVSGTPILVVGRQDAAQVQYAEEKKWGLVVTEESKTVLGESIRKLLTDKQLSLDLIENAKQSALLYHDEKVIRREFQDIFTVVSKRFKHN